MSKPTCDLRLLSHHRSSLIQQLHVSLQVRNLERIMHTAAAMYRLLWSTLQQMITRKECAQAGQKTKGS